MYMPPEFLTVEVVSKVLAEFSWPTSYTVEDWHIDGVAVRFPSCTILFEEGFESEMEAYFLARDTGLKNAVSFSDILLAGGGASTPGLISHFSPGATLEKVQHGLRNLCITLLHHFSQSLLGDFGWVPIYLQHLEQSRSE